jgi:CRP-like cAMP-binding protein
LPATSREDLSVHPLWDNIFRRKADEESVARFLSSVPVFAELRDRDFALLEPLVHLRRYKPQEIVFAEGDPGSGVYVIRSGRVQIFTLSGEGQEEELTVLGGGDFFGETTLTAPASRTASARALETTELIGLFRADLLELAQKQPALANRILLGLTRVVSERLQAAAHEVRRLRAALEAPLPNPGADR